MYRAKIQGSITDSKGKTYRFGKGSLVNAPKGTFDAVKELEWVGPKREQEKQPEKVEPSAEKVKNTVSKPKRRRKRQ